MGDLDRNGYTREPRRYQRVLNQVWPDNPRTFRDQTPIPIRARIVLEDDGQVEIDGQAVRWNRRHVCVILGDPRLQITFVWLLPKDVRRRYGCTNRPPTRQSPPDGP